MPASSISVTWITHVLVVLFALATYVVASLATHQRRHPSSAIAWVLALAAMPYVALPLFLMFGMRKTARAPRRGPAAAAISAGHTPAARLQALAVGLGLAPPTACRDLAIHQDGEQALARLRELLHGARHSIDVSTFLIGNDAVGREVCDLLTQRAREGVRVRLMIDGVGRYLGWLPPLIAVKQAGVSVRLFASPWTSPLMGGRANLRNHRKIAAADGGWVWAGGRNLAAEYFMPSARPTGGVRPAWTDLTFDFRGPLAQQVCRHFEHDWRLAAGERPASRRDADEPVVAGAGPLGQFLPSGPDQGDDTVYALLVDACFNARERIVAVTPYFVPDAVLLMALVLAARRGIEVDLIVPRRSNHRLADAARPGALRDMAEAGARVWLTPGMLHAKLVVVDDTVAFSGSLNLDQRSLFLNYEMMVAFYDAQAIAGFASWAHRVRASAHQMRPPHPSAIRDFREGLLRWLTFQL